MNRIVLCSALVLSTIGAVEPNLAHAQEAAVADTPASIDPKALKLLERMRDAYQKELTFYAATTDFQRSGRHQRAIIAFEKPDRITLAVTDLMGSWKGTTVASSDGKRYTVTTFELVKRHKERPAPQGKFSYLQVLLDNFVGPDSVHLLGPVDWFDDRWRRSLKSLSVVEGGKLDEVTVHTVTAELHFKTQGHNHKSTITWSIGTYDNLVRRRIEVNTTDNQPTSTTIETNTGVTSNLGIEGRGRPTHQ
jgi:hypothetical protein